MKVEKIEFSEAECFHESFLDYMSGDERIRKFYGKDPKIEEFGAQADSKSLSEEARRTLVTVLKEQYSGLDISPEVKANIESLKEKNTFTVTTGHQLNLFTGPLYFIYKIITAINACERLRHQYPKGILYPCIGWLPRTMILMKSRISDLMEQNINGRRIKLGAVGRFDPKELSTLLSEFPAKSTVFEKAYLEQETLADAVRYYVNELLGKYGIVVLDSDNASLKSQFGEVMKADILDHIPQSIVSETSEALTSTGFKTQVHAREINFFYLDDGLRTRIERSGEEFILVDSEKKFSAQEMAELIRDSPEKLSPNVILRPLYQEMILPNLSYIGGPSELVYWLQLKGVFDHFKTEFPILMPRNFALVIPDHLNKKWDKAKLSSRDLFRPMHQLARDMTIQYSDKQLQLNGKADTVDDAFALIRDQAVKIDQTLGPMVEAETVRVRKSLQKIERKMIRAERRRMSDRIGQAEAVKEWLFPGNGLQERKDNFLNFYLTDPEFNAKLKEFLDPFDFRFHILKYE